MNSTNSTGGKMKKQINQDQAKKETNLASGQENLAELKAEKQRLDYKAPRLNKKIRKLQDELSSLEEQGVSKGSLSEKEKHQRTSELKRMLKQVQSERDELESARKQLVNQIQSANQSSMSTAAQPKGKANKTKPLKTGQGVGKSAEVDTKRLVSQFERIHEKLVPLIAEKEDLGRKIKATHEKIRKRQQRQKSLEEESLDVLGLTEDEKIQSQVDLKVELNNLTTSRDELIARREKLNSEVAKQTQMLDGIESKLGYKPDIKSDTSLADKSQSSFSAHTAKVGDSESGGAGVTTLPATHKLDPKDESVSDVTEQIKSDATSMRDSEVYELTPDQSKFAPESSPYTGLRRLRKFFGFY